MPRRQTVLRFTPLLASASIVALSAVALAHGGHGSGTKHKPTPEELAAFNEARPAFEHHCFRCHTATGKKTKRKAKRR